MAFQCAILASTDTRPSHPNGSLLTATLPMLYIDLSRTGFGVKELASGGLGSWAVE